MLVKIVEPKFTVFFDIKDITRITPVFAGEDVDYYALKLANSSGIIQLSTRQLERLTPFLGYIDLDLDLARREEITIPLEGEDFEHLMSELLDEAIRSPSVRPTIDHLKNA
jgi:hypothetical protein